VSFDDKLLDIVCCPATHMPLKSMPEATLARLNALIDAGRLRYRDDSPVTEALTEALITDDGRLAYPIRDDIPLLLEDQGILVAQLDESPNR
jgi:uncharacterized protein YbaR (Trm112 family)